MAEFSFSKSLLGNKKRGALTGSHVAYGLFVLVCCWAGAQMLSMLIHAPGYLNA
ncbi:inner membrane protein [Klebsiella variicola]|nr:inner membrane protein [Klebsiella variicola]